MSLDVYGDHAYIKGNLLRWARERLGLSVPDAANRLRVKPSRWEAWEAGQAYPTMGQAYDLAEKLYIPIGYLYLKNPPSLDLPLPDLRAPNSTGAEEPSAELFDLVSDVFAKQQWYKAYQQEEQATPLPFIGRFSIQDTSEEIASDIARVVGIDASLRMDAKDIDDFIRLCSSNLEERGILIMRRGYVNGNSRVLNPDEFKGFAISDEMAPLIFVNTQDRKVSQVFTLAHELSHLWLGQSGVSNPDFRGIDRAQERTIERKCNQIAANVLVPPSEFMGSWNDQQSEMHNISAMTQRFWVSRFVILRRARDLGKIDRNRYSNMYGQFVASIFDDNDDDEEPREESGARNYHDIFLIRNSPLLTSTILSAIYRERLSATYAAMLMKVRFSTLQGTADRIAKRAIIA